MMAFFHHAEQHDQADEGVEVQLLMKQPQREQRAEHRRRQSRKNRDGMDEALVQDAQHDVDYQDGYDQQDRQPLEGLLEFLHRALEVDADGSRHAQRLHSLFHLLGGIAR